MKKPKALVVRTAGTNCDYETVNAFRVAGAGVELVHINRLVREKPLLSDYHIFVVPGGFANGDYLGAARLLANSLRFNLGKELQSFIEQGNLVLGLCNGFQALVKAGFLPAFNRNYGKQTATITFNGSGHFQDEWVTIENVNKGRCVWVEGIERIFTPINHGEGRFYCRDAGVLSRLHEHDYVVFTYSPNPNASMDGIAGICDGTGRVLGLMPHPEKNVYSLTDPRSTRLELPEEGEGLQLFRRGVEFVKEKLL